MATYNELRNLYDSSDADSLRAKIDVAVVVAANNLLSGTPTAAEQQWAAYVASNPGVESEKAFRLLLAQNSAATVAQITNADDSTVQTNVDLVVPSLVVAFSAGA